MDDARGPRHHELPPRPLSARAEQLVAQAAATDRADGFSGRLARIEAARARRQRRARVLRQMIAVGSAVALAGLGVSWLGPIGLLIGLLAPAGLLARALLQSALARRGGSQWDWVRQRYVVFGSPARRVQRLDRPDGRSDGPEPRDLLR